MAKALKLALSATSRLITNNSTGLICLQSKTCNTLRQYFSNLNCGVAISRTHTTLSSTLRRSTAHIRECPCSTCSKKNVACYSTEVDKEIAKFLEKEIKFENARVSDKSPKLSGFDIKTDGGDVTITKTIGSEKIVVKLSVNGAVDSVYSEQDHEKQDEPPQMICRPPFDVEISKGDGTVLALQCSFPSTDQIFDEAEYNKAKQDTEQIDDQFEIQEVAIHGGEWKDTTFSVAAATMDAELFDLLMDMLDERGINDEFIAQLVEYCTAYENKQYIHFLHSLKNFVEK